MARGRSIVAGELARYGALLGPSTPGATIYDGVTWSFADESGSRAFVPTESALRERPVETLRAAIDDAVDRVVGDASRVAVVTGGGLDSGGLLAYVVRWSKRKSGRSVFAVSCDFEASGDDRPHLAALVGQLGCDVIRMPPEDAGPWFRHALEGVDAAPYVWPTAPFEAALLARAKAHGAEIALTGVGGDELLDGSPLALAVTLAEGRVREAWSTARALEGFARPKFAPLQWLLRPHLAKRVPRWLRARRLRRVWEPPSFAGPTMLAAFATTAHLEAARTTSNLSRVVEFRTRRHRFGIGFLRHQESVAGGLERRDPFFDLGLAETVASLPPDALLRGAYRRGLFRETLRGDVPESFRLRLDKSSFEPAIARSWAAAGGVRLFEPFSAVPRLAALGIVDAAQFRHAWEKLVRAPEDGEGWVTTFLALTMEAFLATRET